MATNSSINSSKPISVAQGGTSATTFTSHAVLVGNSTSAPTAISVGSTGQLLIGVSSSDPAFNSSASADFTFSSSTAGSTRTLTVSNTDNTAAATSASTGQISVGGGNVGDPVVTHTISGATSFTYGIDNSASDAFVIAASTALGTTNTLSIATTGEMVRPLQPAFSAELGSPVTDVTGDGTTYTLIPGSVIFDQHTDYNSGTGTFTAPSTGTYLLIYCLRMSGLLAGHTSGQMQIVTTNRTYTNYVKNFVSVATSGVIAQDMETIADMAAGDTATCTIQISGSTKVVDIDSGAGTLSRFGGFLLG